MDQKTILVVEDETELLGLIVKRLKAEGFLVLNAQSVADAIDILNKNKVDALWLDHYLLGDKNGFDLVVELKSNEEAWGKIPVFVVSNTAGPEEIKSYIQLNVNKYYVKSNSHLNQIIEDIKSLFNAQNANSEQA